MRMLIFVISLLCLVSCKQEKSQSNEDYSPSRRGVLGKYVYMSTGDILHSKLQCPLLQREKDDKGHNVIGVEFVDTNEFYPNYKFFYCKYCFNDTKYEQIKRILERNRPDNTSGETVREETDSIFF